jgi:hypothetical protein
MPVMGNGSQTTDVEAGHWAIYKHENGTLSPIFVHWSTRPSFDEKRIVSRPFGRLEEAEGFLKDFWQVWWGMGLT